jgi:hypothetical protein
MMDLLNRVYTLNWVSTIRGEVQPARLVALKAAILVQRGLPRVADGLRVGHLLVVRLAGVGVAQIADPSGLRIHNHDVLVAVSFLPPAVVLGLFFRAFRALATPLGAVNDEVERLALTPLVTRELPGVAFGEEAQVIQRPQQDRQQAVDPAVDPGLAQVKGAAQQFLQRIRLLVDQDEQQLVLEATQDAPAAAAGPPLAGLPRPGLVRRGGAGRRASESRQQLLELLGRQSRQRYEPSLIVFQALVI